MAAGSSRGRASRSASLRAPGAVTVRSTQARSEPSRPPFGARSISRLARVAGVDGHGLGGAAPAGRGEDGQAARLRGLQVGGDQAEGDDFRRLQRAEAIQRIDAVKPLYARFAGGKLGQGAGHGLGEAAGGFQRGGGLRVGEQAVGDQDFRGTKRRQDRAEAGTVEKEGFHVAGGELHARQRRLAAPDRHGGEAVGAARIQEAVFGEGAGRHHPHQIPPHDGLGAALLGLRRVLHLFAYGDFETGTDQFGEVGFGGVDWHAAHGDILARVLAAIGQGDAEGLGGFARVVEEEFVEIAHAEEDQSVGLLGLGVEELLHHRRRPFGRGSGVRYGRLFHVCRGVHAGDANRSGGESEARSSIRAVVTPGPGR